MSNSESLFDDDYDLVWVSVPLNDGDDNDSDGDV